MLRPADPLASPLSSGNVLKLSGSGNYLELPAALFEGLNTATLECRVKWHTFEGNQHVFEFDAAKRVKVGNPSGQPNLEFFAAALGDDVPRRSTTVPRACHALLAKSELSMRVAKVSQ